MLFSQFFTFGKVFAKIFRKIVNFSDSLDKLKNFFRVYFSGLVQLKMSTFVKSNRTKISRLSTLEKLFN